MENCGRADSLQNANHCRPIVFVYIEKLRLNVEADIMRPYGEPPYPIRVDNLFCIIQTVYTREKNTREKTQEKKTAV